MSQDPRVKAAIAHWGPRFVANGVVLTDFEEITGSLASYDDWCRAWSERAAHHEQLGRDAMAGGYRLTAGECLQRAGVYYHFASFLFVHDVAQMKTAHMKAVDCRQAALPLLRPPGERVDIPYEGKTLAGILRKPAGVERPPVVMMAVGLDSTKEEGDAYEAPFLARGMATLIFDGPGQGEGQYDFAIRGDYEAAVKAVADYVETRGDLDGARLGMWGVSLGGYYAPRAAAFEKRIKACIALGGPFDWGAAWDGLPEQNFAIPETGDAGSRGFLQNCNGVTLLFDSIGSNENCLLPTKLQTAIELHRMLTNRRWSMIVLWFRSTTFRSARFARCPAPFVLLPSHKK